MCCYKRRFIASQTKCERKMLVRPPSGGWRNIAFLHLDIIKNGENEVKWKSIMARVMNKEEEEGGSIFVRLWLSAKTFVSSFSSLQRNWNLKSLKGTLDN